MDYRVRTEACTVETEEAVFKVVSELPPEPLRNVLLIGTGFTCRMFGPATIRALVKVWCDTGPIFPTAYEEYFGGHPCLFLLDCAETIRELLEQRSEHASEAVPVF